MREPSFSGASNVGILIRRRRQKKWYELNIYSPYAALFKRNTRRPCSARTTPCKIVENFYQIRT